MRFAHPGASRALGPEQLMAPIHTFLNQTSLINFVHFLSFNFQTVLSLFLLKELLCLIVALARLQIFNCFSLLLPLRMDADQLREHVRFLGKPEV